jgi:hypothetical protein
MPGAGPRIRICLRQSTSGQTRIRHGALCGERPPLGGGLARIIGARKQQPSHTAELSANLYKCRAATREMGRAAASHPTLPYR